jgi:hypothetical protein
VAFYSILDLISSILGRFAPAKDKENSGRIVGLLAKLVVNPPLFGGGLVLLRGRAILARPQKWPFLLILRVKSPKMRAGRLPSEKVAFKPGLSLRDKRISYTLYSLYIKKSFYSFAIKIFFYKK